MRNWPTIALKMIAQDVEVVSATIVDVKGSAPCDIGTCMLISHQNQKGTIGGGNLEFQVIEQARKLLTASGDFYRFQQYALGPLLEQCCGGTVILLLERLDETASEFLQKLTSNANCHIQTEFKKNTIQKTILEVEDQTTTGQSLQFFTADGTVTDDPANASRMLEKPVSPHTPLYMFGAGHVGKAVASAAKPLPFDVTWVDSRANEFPDDGIPHYTKQVTNDALSVVNTALPNSLFLIFTHSHQLDYDITAAVLARQDAAYCGLIGSTTKRARFASRMEKESDLTKADLTQLTCPIGIDTIDGKEPAIIAASVVAELLMVTKAMKTKD